MAKEVVTDYTTDLAIIFFLKDIGLPPIISSHQFQHGKQVFFFMGKSQIMKIGALKIYLTRTQLIIRTKIALFSSFVP